MNDINATIGLCNLPYVSKLLETHRQNAQYYFEHLKNIKGITLLENNNDRQGSWWLFTFLVENKNIFIEKMKEKGIIVSQVHQRNDVHSCVEKYKQTLKYLDELESKIICIPVGWWVTKDDREYIVESIKESMYDID